MYLKHSIESGYWLRMYKKNNLKMRFFDDFTVFLFIKVKSLTTTAYHCIRLFEHPILCYFFLYFHHHQIYLKWNLINKWFHNYTLYMFCLNLNEYALHVYEGISFSGNITFLCWHKNLSSHCLFKKLQDIIP